MKQLIPFILLGLSVSAFAADYKQAESLYQHTEYAAALKALGSGPLDADGYLLAGKCWFMSGEFKKATEVFEKAVALAPKSSDAYLWLGRAYGRRAETSSFVSAPSFASKSRQNFERSVELDPKNKEAIDDLFDYYLQAPSFLGGGFDKAAALARHIGEIDPAEGHYAQAQLAIHKKESRMAEDQLRSAIDLAPRQVGRVLDLAKFLSKQGRIQESEAMFAKAEQIAPESPKVMYARASTYIKEQRNIETAQALLRKYLSLRLTPDDPPRSEAQKLLKQASGM